MNEYLDVIDKSAADIWRIAGALADLSKAFYVTGNPNLGVKLAALAMELDAAQEAINRAVGKEISSRCQEAQQSAYNTVAACLAVAAREGDQKDG